MTKYLALTALLAVACVNTPTTEKQEVKRYTIEGLQDTLFIDGKTIYQKTHTNIYNFYYYTLTRYSANAKMDTLYKTADSTNTDDKWYYHGYIPTFAKNDSGYHLINHPEYAYKLIK
jgi:hypothetical protein